jgi:L-lactate dehydrogenase
VIVGCGSVGATAAYAILIDGTPTEFEHTLSFLPYTKITAIDDYSACANSQIIFITAGAKQQEGETRLQFIDKNRKFFRRSSLLWQNQLRR